MSKLKALVMMLGLYATASHAFILQASPPVLGMVRFKATEVVCYMPGATVNPKFRNVMVVGLGEGLWRIETNRGSILYLPTNACIVEAVPEDK